MMPLCIQGVGLAAPFGGKAALKQAALGDDPVSTAAPKVGTEDLARYVPPRQRRRIDHFTSMTLLAAFRALEHAGTLDPLPQRLGIVLCTGYGPSKTTFDFLDSIIDDGARLASPLAFSQSVHNSAEHAAGGSLPADHAVPAPGPRAGGLAYRCAVAGRRPGGQHSAGRC